MTEAPRHQPPFANYQAELLLWGMSGVAPEQPLRWTELERAAEEALDPRVAGYVFAGAGSEDTMRENLEAFRRWRLLPRMLRDVSQRDLSRTVLGTPMPAPVALAPVGVLPAVHPDGALEVARAAAALDLTMTLGTAAGHTPEQVAEAGSGAPKWFQLYWPRDPELAASIVARAEAAGYTAILVTVDLMLPGWKPRDLQSGWQPFFDGIGLATYTSDPVFRARLPAPPEEDPQASIVEFIAQFSHPELTWDKLEALREQTSLPIVVKGILHPDDAREARERGLDGVVVSNHGGRQVDGSIAALDALPEIADAVGGDLTVLFDSGIRTGADIAKALALGADAVLIGRPWIWGLALAGEAGVLTVLRALLAELDLTIGLCGLTSVDQLDRSLLVRV